MTLPLSPTPAQLHVDGITGRRFRYDSASNSWRPERITDLKELQDVSDTVPAAGSKMVYNLSNLEYAPVNDSSTSYVPMVYSERDPLETDNASVGTMWVNEGIPNEVTAWMATYTNGTNTFWRELAVHPSVPLFAASPTAPTSPQQGTIWVDSNFNPPRAKYWLGTAWRNIA